MKDMIDAYVFRKISENLDPKTLQSFVTVNKQFYDWRYCVTKTLIYNGEEKDMIGILTRSFAKTFPNMRTLIMYDVEWKIYFSDNIRYLETLATMPQNFDDYRASISFPSHEEEKQITSYTASHVIFFDNTNCIFTQSNYNIHHYFAFDHGLLSTQSYTDRSLNNDRYIEIDIRGAHSCYDLVLEFKKPVDNCRCKFRIGGQDVAMDIECVKINPTMYKITNFTKNNQLSLLQCFWTKTLRITYDGLDLTTALPVKLSGMRCRIQPSVSMLGTVREDNLSFNPETREVLRAPGVRLY